MSRMELRHIRYFATIAREGNISRAAKALGISQPALSKQLFELEEELGQTLFERTARGVRLTAKGLVFRQRAEEIMSLVDRAAREVSCAKSRLAGQITLGSSETFAFKFVAAALRSLVAENPAVSFRIVSGNAEDLAGRVKQGELDLALLIGPTRIENCETLSLGAYHRLGLVLRRDDPLAKKSEITPDDILNRTLLMPRRLQLSNEVAGWSGINYARLNVVGTFNLLHNAAYAVDEGLASAAFSNDGLIPAVLADRLVFRPFQPEFYTEVYLAWKNTEALSPAAAALVETVRLKSAECIGLEEAISEREEAV